MIVRSLSARRMLETTDLSPVGGDFDHSRPPITDRYVATGSQPLYMSSNYRETPRWAGQYHRRSRISYWLKIDS